jgi:hypothetical protein
MDDVEQLKLLLKKYLEVSVQSMQSTVDTLIQVEVLFDGEVISASQTQFMND